MAKIQIMRTARPTMVPRKTRSTGKYNEIREAAGKLKPGEWFECAGTNGTTERDHKLRQSVMNAVRVYLKKHAVTGVACGISKVSGNVVVFAADEV